MKSTNYSLVHDPLAKTKNRWPTIEEILRFLDFFEIDNKKNVLMQQIDVISRSISIYEQKYSPEKIVQRFEYFAKLRSC